MVLDKNKNFQILFKTALILWKSVLSYIFKNKIIPWPLKHAVQGFKSVWIKYWVLPHCVLTLGVASSDEDNCTKHQNLFMKEKNCILVFWGLKLVFPSPKLVFVLNEIDPPV